MLTYPNRSAQRPPPDYGTDHWLNAQKGDWLSIEEIVCGNKRQQLRMQVDAAFAIDANNTAQILKDKGDLDDALSYAQRALKILTQTYGPDYPLTKMAASNLEKIQSQMKQ